MNATAADLGSEYTPLAHTVWGVSTQDFGGYSSRDANAVARALLTSDWLRQHDAEVSATALEDAAADIAENVDWSDGRNGYGDNAGYEDSARILRDRAAEIRREAA